MATSKLMPVVEPVTKRSDVKVHSVLDICRVLGVSKGFITAQIKAGELRVCRLGKRRIVVLDEDLREYLERARTDTCR